MRAKEFTYEVQGNLGNALRGLAATSAQQASQTKDLNAKQTGVSTQTAQPAVPPTQATSGGTTTAQNGVPSVSQKPAGFMDVVKSQIGSVKDNLKDKVAAGLGLSNTRDAMKAASATVPDLANVPTQALNLQKGKTLKVDQIGDVTVKRIDPLKGIQLDTSKTNLGVPEINVDLRQLAKAK